MSNIGTLCNQPKVVPEMENKPSEATKWQWEGVDRLELLAVCDEDSLLVYTHIHWSQEANLFPSKSQKQFFLKIYHNHPLAFDQNVPSEPYNKYEKYLTRTWWHVLPKYVSKIIIIVFDQICNNPTRKAVTPLQRVPTQLDMMSAALDGQLLLSAILYFKKLVLPAISPVYGDNMSSTDILQP